MAATRSPDVKDPVRRTSVALLFVGSGAAALIYEVVWFHLLRLVIGGSWISLGIVLACFMGGMCVGSLLCPLVVPARWHPLRVYAALEAAIGLLGATVPWWLPAVGRWYSSVADYSASGIAARAIVAGACLLPSTILMGATLPAIARWVKATPDGLAALGVFYGANTLGAVLGCLTAGFVLLPQTDVVYSSYVAAAINGLVALAALAFAGRTEYEPIAESAPPVAPARGGKKDFVVLVVIGLSGFTALAAEVVWTRLLSLLFGVTVYAFAIILAVFLTGLGIGSLLATRWSVRAKYPLRWLAACQLAIAILIPLASGMITRVMPYWRRPAVSDTSDVFLLFLFDTLRAVLAVLPTAMLWGASFVLALAATAGERGDTGRLVGRVYGANTLGAIFGALVTSAVLVPLIGSWHTQQVIVAAAGLGSIIAFRATSSTAKVGNSAVAWTKFGPLVATVAAALMVLPPPHGFFARSLQPWTWDGEYTHVYEREGRNTPVVVQDYRGKMRLLCVAGKVEASTIPKDLRCQRFLGHLPALIHGHPKRTLTVGLGAGTTAGCFVLYPEIEQINICEIEPAVVEAARVGFAKENHGVVDDPRTVIRIDDARHFLATTHEKFDIITTDPIHPWVRGSAALYSLEYYELCKQHLNPGGVVVQWIPLYQSDLATVKCELATFLTAFPYATLWTSWIDGDDPTEGHDIIAVAQMDPPSIDMDELERRIEGNPRLKAALAEVNAGTVGELFGQYAGWAQDLRPWFADTPVNEDRSLKLEYLAGLSLWINQADAIFREMTEYRRYPAEIVTHDERFREDIRRRLRLPLTSE